MRKNLEEVCFDNKELQKLYEEGNLSRLRELFEDEDFVSLQSGNDFFEFPFAISNLIKSQGND